jgi:archaemetzincin
MTATITLASVRAAGGTPLGGADVVDLELLDWAAAALARALHLSCRVLTESIDAAFAFDPSRNQYHSTRILQMLDARAAARGGAEGLLLAITGLDLYVPVLTFVFGEAQRPGRCAVVSTHRLREEFYGLPANPGRLRERLVKECLHELGHNFGLAHCEDWRCVMSSAHAVERIDLRGAAFCERCCPAIAPGARGSPARGGARA